MGPCSLTPVSPTFDQKVVFCIFLKILYLASKQHPKADVHFDGEWTKTALSEDFYDSRGWARRR